MKKLFTLFSVAILVTFSSCIKELPESESEAGNIPGMGETAGELEIVEQFVLPEGVTIVGEISGGIASEAPTDDDLKSTMRHRSRGSGNQVRCDFTFRNDRPEPCDVEIPAGTVVECKTKEGEPNGQHGICLQTIRIHLLGNEMVQMKFYLYCLNQGRPGSRTLDTYIIRGITGSESFGDLCNALSPKKIDISQFSDRMEDYNVITERIQQCVWQLTNSIYGVRQKDWDYIKKLEDME